ncbi:hypothetical protein [Nostoc sp. NIES-3756]|nr:hypothetical protein [Nostoc sp. NIES-3756]
MSKGATPALVLVQNQGNCTSFSNQQSHFIRKGDGRVLFLSVKYECDR